MYRLSPIPRMEFDRFREPIFHFYLVAVLVKVCCILLSFCCIYPQYTLFCLICWMLTYIQIHFHVQIFSRKQNDQNYVIIAPFQSNLSYLSYGIVLKNAHLAT